MSGGSPQVSVVMGVRDAAAVIDRTLDSVLSQDAVDLECLVVDDGSRDDTPRRVAERARRDPRVRLLRQADAGLTRALINGCSEARAPLLARIDAGDRMLPGRLRRQLSVLEQRADLDLLATGSRLRGPCGEHLVPEPVSRPGAVSDLREDLSCGDPARLIGVTHVSVCMRRRAYRAAGGYRAAFRLSQDVDLWTRLAERGGVGRLEEVLTEVRVELDGLSPRHPDIQRRLRRLAAGAARARRRGEDESPWLARAEALSRRALEGGGLSGGAALFVAGCLSRHGDPRGAHRYYRLALEQRPGSVRAILGLTRNRLRALLAPAGRVS